MLNSDTKRHIDAARDVLVGVAPNPTTQIDQITYALIYKFMDDMDQASVKAGGESSFFVGDLEKYAWSKLMSTRMGNQQKMDLYSEALTKFSEAKQLPELFRTIFRAAFLPYRSPETLGLFLKEISYFDYTHPEELGNAYEYLLSIMSSQGDAGQFRTPRHIIDFIVDVINPTKDDKVLDPACGTGGFLVSTYNHILEQHDVKDDPKKKEKPLTPDERKKLMSNLQGYDIDPTMVRIAQVNMYLHQFKNPQIFQYDSLTSEERWNDKYDVILANPPFMTPKGGIKPHNKFGISSSRSEVLFVDYIMNHLRPNGRAGIIVPDGVVTKTDTSYKQLRKNMLEDGVYAVVSLPSGVFQPYSGVKTSILLFDKNVAKSHDEILFVEILNDGFDLGSSKKSIELNDIPKSLIAIRKWQQGAVEIENSFLKVKKEEISQSGQYILAGNRFKTSDSHSISSYPIVEIGEVAKLHTGGTPQSTRKEYYGGSNKWLVSGDIHQGEIFDCAGRITDLALKDSNAKVLPMNSVLMALNGQGKTRGTVALLRTEATCNQSLVAIETDSNKLLPEFLYFVLKGMYQDIRNINGENQRGGLNMPLIRKIRIPIPPIKTQQEYIKMLNGFTTVIQGAKQIVTNWKPFVPLNSECQLLKISDLVQTITAPKKIAASEYGEEGTLPIIDQSQVPIAGWTSDLAATVFSSEGLVIFGDHTCSIKYADFPFAQGADGIKILKTNENVIPKFLYYYLLAYPLQSSGYKRHFAELKELKIKLPSIKSQKEIIESIEREYTSVQNAGELLRAYENRIEQIVTSFWNE